MSKTQRANENLKQIHVAGAKRGKTRVTKSRLVLVLHLIGWAGGASFLNQSARSKAKPKKFRMTFDTQLKTALVYRDIALLIPVSTW